MNTMFTSQRCPFIYINNVCVFQLSLPDRDGGQGVAQHSSAHPARGHDPAVPPAGEDREGPGARRRQCADRGCEYI